MRYLGGKGQAGVYQRIISMMPPHDVYIEPFVGGGNILERKKPAQRSIALDIDPDVAAEWVRIAERGDVAGLTVINGDAVAFLRSYAWTGRELVYADPPYVASTCATGHRLGARYRFEYTDAQHFELLDVLRSLPCKVILSGYRCAMYNASLVHWHREDFEARTRGGRIATESLWSNFEPPTELHDYRHIGGNFREREKIKRKRKRWRARFEALPRLEQLGMLEVLLELTSPEVASVDVEPVRPKRTPFALGELPSAFPWPRDPGVSRASARRMVGLDASSSTPGTEGAAHAPDIHDDAFCAGGMCPVRQKPCDTLAACEGSERCPLLGGPNAQQIPSSQLSLLEDSQEGLCRHR